MPCEEDGTFTLMLQLMVETLQFLHLQRIRCILVAAPLVVVRILP